MPQYIADILVLGATGFTGSLVTKYLSTHQQHSEFTFAIAGRSTRKLQTLVTKLALHVHVPVLEVDVLDTSRLDDVVQEFKIVINAIGPYWKWGTPVVLACARAGTHYVDIAGETPWIKRIVNELGDIPSQTGSLIVPACGLASVPSDLGAFMSITALRSHFGLDIQAECSTTAHELNRGVDHRFSKGTLHSLLSLFEDVPRSEFLTSLQPYYLSPVKGDPKPFPQLYNSLPVYRPHVMGSFFGLALGHTAVVDRTWGLLELQKSRGRCDRRKPDGLSYGPHFIYTEFLRMPSPWLAAPASICFMGLFFLLFLPPVRWLLKALLVHDITDQPTAGHSESINVTSGALPGDVKLLKHARSTFRMKVDPFYVGASALVSECALGLLLTPRSQLPRDIDVLTPVTALGTILVERLKSTEIFEVESEILSEPDIVQYRA